MWFEACARSSISTLNDDEHNHRHPPHPVLNPDMCLHWGRDMTHSGLSPPCSVLYPLPQRPAHVPRIFFWSMCVLLGQRDRIQPGVGFSPPCCSPIGVIALFPHRPAHVPTTNCGLT